MSSPEQVMQRVAGNVFAGEVNAARIGWDGPGHQVEQRGLARAVGSDQAGDGALGYREAGVVDRADTPEGLAQMADL